MLFCKWSCFIILNYNQGIQVHSIWAIFWGLLAWEIRSMTFWLRGLPALKVFSLSALQDKNWALVWTCRTLVLILSRNWASVTERWLAKCQVASSSRTNKQRYWSSSNSGSVKQRAVAIKQLVNIPSMPIGVMNSWMLGVNRKGIASPLPNKGFAAFQPNYTIRSLLWVNNYSDTYQVRARSSTHYPCCGISWSCEAFCDLH